MGPDTDSAALRPLVSSLLTALALLPLFLRPLAQLHGGAAGSGGRAFTLAAQFGAAQRREPLINDERRGPSSRASRHARFCPVAVQVNSACVPIWLLFFLLLLLRSRRSLLNQPPNRVSLEARQLLLISQSPLRQHRTQARGRFSVSSGGSCEQPGAPSGSGNRASSINWNRWYHSSSL